MKSLSYARAPALSRLRSRPRVEPLGAAFELVRLETAHGHEFYMPRGCVPSQQRAIERTGSYEAATTAAIYRFVQPGMNVVDCGANCGFHTLNLARATGQSGHVLSVEANPELIAILERNVRSNGYAKFVDVVNLGLWKEDAILPFPLRSRSLGGAGLKRKRKAWPLARLKPDSKVKRWIDLEVRSLGSLCGERRVDLIRMDVEGAEYEAILGSRAFLRDRDITLIMEWLGKNSTRRVTRHLFDTLVRLGYRVFRITDGGLLAIESGRALFEDHRDLCEAGQRDLLCLKRCD